MALNTTIVSERPLKSQVSCSQVVQIEDIRRSDALRELINMTIFSNENSQQFEEQQVAGLNKSALKILALLLEHPEGFTTGEIAKQVGISRGQARKNAANLVGRGLLERTVTPHKSDKMPPTHKYNLGSRIDEKRLKSVIEAFPTLEVKALNNNREEILESQEMSEFPAFFEEYLGDVKRTYRGGYWTVFSCVSDNEPITVRDIRLKIGAGNSVTHSRLAKLVEVGLVERDKRDKQYIYSLTPKARDMKVLAVNLPRQILEVSAARDLIQASLPSDTPHEAVHSGPSVYDQSEHYNDGLEAMNHSTLNDLASAVKLIAFEIAKLNQRISKIERTQEMMDSDFKLEEIERIVRDGRQDVGK